MISKQELLDAIAVNISVGKANANSPFPKDLIGKDGAFEFTQRAIDSGINPNEVLNLGLIKGMQTVGEKFKTGKAFIPDVLIAAKALNICMTILKPFYLSEVIKSKGKIVIGTVHGDLHDIGKNIVGLILQGNGYEIIDLGVNITAARFLEIIDSEKPIAVGLSALLTTTMLNMKEIVQEIKTKYPDLLVLVGGAPLSLEFAKEINADFYSPDPHDVVSFLEKISSAKSGVID